MSPRTLIFWLLHFLSYNNYFLTAFPWGQSQGIINSTLHQIITGTTGTELFTLNPKYTFQLNMKKLKVDIFFLILKEVNLRWNDPYTLNRSPE